MISTRRTLFWSLKFKTKFRLFSIWNLKEIETETSANISAKNWKSTSLSTCSTNNSQMVSRSRLTRTSISLGENSVSHANKTRFSNKSSRNYQFSITIMKVKIDNWKRTYSECKENTNNSFWSTKTSNPGSMNSNNESSSSRTSQENSERKQRIWTLKERR